MPQTRKNISLIFLTGALISMVLLAASLSNMQLQSGSSFPVVDNLGNSFDIMKSPPDTEQAANPLLHGVFAFFLLICMLYIAGKLIAFVRIKQILWLLLVVGVLFLLVWLLPDDRARQAAMPPAEYIEPLAAPSVKILTAPLGQPPQILVWVLVALSILGMIFLSIEWLKHGMGSTKAQDRLLEEAQHAVSSLKSGMGLKNVIFRCYLQMSRVLQEEQGIERSEHLTVQEFEASLNAKGLPPVPVHQLTALFEKARYSELKLNNDDERLALESLDAIIDFCRKEEN